MRQFSFFIKYVIQQNYFVTVCFLAAATLRIIWISLYDVYPVSDCQFYFQSAIDLSIGNGYLRNGVLTDFWPVGYPVFLAIVFLVFEISIKIAQFSNVTLSLISLLVFYALCIRLFKSKSIARIAFFFLALFPDQIFYNALVFSESLSFFLLILGLYLYTHTSFSKTTCLLSSSIIFSFACYVKPQFILVPALCVFSEYLTQKHSVISLFRKGLLIYVIIIVCVLPWTIRNKKVTDKYTFISSNGGINLLIGNSPIATGTFIGNQGIIIAAKGSDIPPGQHALKYIRKNPLRFFLLWPKKFYYLYLDYKSEPLAWMSFSMLPETFTQNEFFAISKDLREKGLDSRLFFEHFKKNNQTNHYHLDKKASDQVKTNLANLILKSPSYKYKPPKEFNILSYFWIVARYFILTSFLLYVFSIFFKIDMRKKLLENQHSCIGILLILYFSLVYLVFFGETRFSFSIMPFIIMYSSVFLDRVLSGDTS